MSSSVTVTVVNHTVTVTGGETVTVPVETVQVVTAGIATLTGLLDTNFGTLVDNDIVIWDNDTQKFINLSAELLLTGSFLETDGSNSMTGAINTDVGKLTSNVAATGTSFKLNSLNKNTAIGSMLSLIDGDGDTRLEIKPKASTLVDGIDGIEFNIPVNATGGLEVLTNMYFSGVGAFGVYKFSSGASFFEIDPTAGSFNISTFNMLFKVGGLTVLDCSSSRFIGKASGGTDIGETGTRFGDLFLEGVIDTSAGTFLSNVGVNASQAAYTFTSASNIKQNINYRYASFLDASGNGLHLVSGEAIIGGRNFVFDPVGYVGAFDGMDFKTHGILGSTNFTTDYLGTDYKIGFRPYSSQLFTASSVLNFAINESTAVLAADATHLRPASIAYDLGSNAYPFENLWLDGYLKVNDIFERTTGAGVTIDGVLIKDGGLTIVDAQSIIVGSTTGAKIGTATTQKIGFWNATPVVQPSGTGETVGYSHVTSTAVHSSSTFTGNLGTTAYTLNDIVKALKQVGILAA